MRMTSITSGHSPCWQRAPLTVASRQPCEVRISAPAFEDIAEIWDWTVERFGNAVPLR
jgi:hypothetical protein